jgi:hypothetical protein
VTHNMCGILCVLRGSIDASSLSQADIGGATPSSLQVQGELLPHTFHDALVCRGPDYLQRYDIMTRCECDVLLPSGKGACADSTKRKHADILLLSSTLQVRGTTASPMPHVDEDNNVLCFNGMLLVLGHRTPHCCTSPPMHGQLRLCLAGPLHNSMHML